MNFIEIIQKRIKEARGYVNINNPLISLYEDDNGKNFLGFSSIGFTNEKNIVSNSKSIREVISTRVLDRKNHMDYRFKFDSREHSGLRFLGKFHTGDCLPVYNNSTKLLMYPGYEVRCRSFENNDPFKKNHDGLKKLSAKID